MIKVWGNMENKPIDDIPQGIYCYEIVDIDYSQNPPIVRIKRCPYLSYRDDHPEQMDGYCEFLERGDWDGGGMLWDGVKECGVNLGDFENDE